MTKFFVATKPLSQQIFVIVNIILSQQKFSRVITKHIFCRDKIFKCHFCCNKRFVAGNMHKHNFVVTNILLSRQKTCFGATKNILVAAPTDDGKPVV